MAAKGNPFNKYTLAEAYKFLHLSDPIAWDISYEPVEPRVQFS